MKTQFKKSGDTVVVTIEGRLDHETQAPLRENLHKLVTPNPARDSVPRKIIFNLEQLEFVGSSGISSFVQTLRDFNAHAPVRPKYCRVGSEFQKVFRAFDEENAFEFFETEERAKRSYDQ